MQKINTAIIGLGRIASLLEDDTLREKPATHAGAITENENCRLLCGCDTDKERRTLFEQKYSVPVFDDARLMFDAMKERDTPIQLLHICTHSDTHKQFAELAAEHNVQVIVCEKPLANTYADAKTIARIKGPKIIVNHERRYALDYITVKEIAESGTLGKLLSVNGKIYMGAGARLVDVLWHDATHLVDAIMFLTDMRIVHKKTYGSKLTSNTGTAFLFGKLRNKGKVVPCVIEIGAERDHLVFEIALSFEKGLLRIGNGVYEMWESAPSPYAEKFRSLKKTVDAFNGKTGYFTNMLHDAVLCALDKSHTPKSGAKDALQVIRYLNSVCKWK
jgi:predicted dehydrogenase